MQSSPRRVGLYGGAFDPPHRTHVALARAALKQLQLDVLHVVPTGQAWHKQRSLTAAEHRLAMCRLAFADLPHTLVDARETQRSGPSYTLDTVQELQAQYPQAQIYLLMGEDQAHALPQWHRAGELVRAAIICVASRPDAEDSGQTAAKAGALPDLLPGLVLQTLQLPPSPLNATEIRARAAQGQSVSALVFASVARYIDQYHLYPSA